MVEALHHGAATHKGPAQWGADEEQRREQTFLSHVSKYSDYFWVYFPYQLLGVALELHCNSILRVTSHEVATCCVLGGDPAAQAEAGEGGEGAERVETQHRSTGEQGGSPLSSCCRVDFFFFSLAKMLRASPLPSITTPVFFSRLQTCWQNWPTREAPVSQLRSCWRRRRQRDSAWRRTSKTCRHARACTPKSKKLVV